MTIQLSLSTPRYERHGQCNRCGWCCQFENCEHFEPASQENGNKAICLIHDKKRPLKCESFPALPPILYGKCGYWFYDRWHRKKLGHKEV